MKKEQRNTPSEGEKASNGGKEGMNCHPLFQG